MATKRDFEQVCYRPWRKEGVVCVVIISGAGCHNGTCQILEFEATFKLYLSQLTLKTHNNLQIRVPMNKNVHFETVFKS